MNVYSWHLNIRAISKDNEKIFNRHGRPFLSTKYKQFEKDLRIAFFLAGGAGFKPLEGDLEVHLMFFFKNRVHSDLFNLPKSICDAFNGVIWVDDRQIKLGRLGIVEDKRQNECIRLEVMEMNS